jgi:hypothetical protein
MNIHAGMTKAEILKAARQLWKEDKQRRRAERLQEFNAKHQRDRTIGVVYSAFPLPSDLDVDRIGKNAVLFLRCRGVDLKCAMAAIKALGFKYKTCFAVLLPVIGKSDGFLLEAHVHVLVATRGNIPAPAPGTQFPSVTEEAAVRKMISSYFPNTPTIGASCLLDGGAE